MKGGTSLYIRGPDRGLSGGGNLQMKIEKINFLIGPTLILSQSSFWIGWGKPDD